MSRVFLTGAAGQLGSVLHARLRATGEVFATDLTDDPGTGVRALDLRDADALRGALRDFAPATIVNPAAYTAVDRAETEPETAAAVNAGAPAVLAEEASRAGALLVHFSTDYVFDGTATRPYREDDPVAPLGVYGRTKAEGEDAARTAPRHLVFRTAWLYGRRGPSFLHTMLRLAGERPRLRVVDDQVGCPTSAEALGAAVAGLLSRDPGGSDLPWGTYHLCAGGQTSWCGFARAILEGVGSPVEVEAIPTAEYPTPAARPAYSVLDCTRARERLGLSLTGWRDQLAEVLRGLDPDRLPA